MTSQRPTVQTFDQLMNPPLAALRALGGSASIRELVERVIADLRLPPEVAEQPHPGSNSWAELEYRLPWARSYLKKYGFDLIDGELLADKLKELGLGVKTKTVEAVEIDENGFSSLRPREVHEHEQLRDFVWATRA